MGYVVEDYIIVTSWNLEHLEEARQKANELFGRLVTPRFVHDVNFSETFFILSSGSKNGWVEKQDYERRAKEFLEWLRSKNLFVTGVVVHIPEEPELSHLGPVIGYVEEHQNDR